MNCAVADLCRVGSKTLMNNDKDSDTDKDKDKDSDTVTLLAGHATPLLALEARYMHISVRQRLC